jgi:hypothetical protein
MGVGIAFWVGVKQFLGKHIADGNLPSPHTDPSVVPSTVSVQIDPYLY